MKFLKNLLISVAILFTMILLVEVIGRKIIAPEFVRLIGDPDHRMKPFSEKDVNEDGIRFRGNSATVAEQNPVIFLGDSFTYGYRLRYMLTIPQQFETLYNTEQKPGIKVVNFGWISSSPVLSYRLLKDIGEKYHPKTIFLVLDMTDMWDDNLYTTLLSGSLTGFFGKHLPVTTIAVYQLIFHIPPLYEFVYGQPINRFFHSAHPLSETQHLFTRSAETIKEISVYSKNILHANFVLVVMPRNYQYSDKEAPLSPDRHQDNFKYQDLGPYVEEPFRYFEAYKKTVDFPVILLLEDFKHSGIFPTTFDNDSHLNPQGAKFAASAIYKHCMEINCLAPRQ